VKVSISGSWSCPCDSASDRLEQGGRETAQLGGANSTCGHPLPPLEARQKHGQKHGRSPGSRHARLLRVLGWSAGAPACAAFARLGWERPAGAVHFKSGRAAGSLAC